MLKDDEGMKTKVCTVEELLNGKSKVVEVGDNRIMVANVGGKYYAMHAICNHEGGPLGEGELSGNEVTCPWHGSMWNITTGKLVWFTMKLDDEPTYKVSVEAGTIYVDA